MTFKQKIYEHYVTVISDKIKMLQQVLADLKESGANETKSTAGDKHETALAMLQIEQANTREQLEKIVQQKTALEKINPAITASIVVNGSLINTNRGYFFMSIAAGKAIVDGVTVMALSPQSPLSIKLMGLKPGDKAEVNNNSYSIESIV
jgi:transcription elongation GreA/GreB family factor